MPSKLSARVRVLSSGNARKNDELDALATALAAWRNERLATVDPEAESEVLRLLSERREDLVAERTRAFNRLHRLLGSRARRGTGDTLGPPSRPHPARHTTEGFLGPHPPAVGFGDHARHPHAGAKDRGPKRAHRSRGRSVRLQPHRDIRHRSHTSRKDHRDGVGSVARFPTKAHFASYSGTAPVEASSGELVRHRLSLAGNRQLNNALHMVAVCQARSDARGRAYYRKKMAEGKSRKEALRCLKRRISDAVFKSLMADSLQQPSCGVA